MGKNWFVDLMALSAETERLLRHGLAPGEEVVFLNGDRIMALLELLFGRAGYAETGRRMDIPDGDIVVCYFTDCFSESAKNLNITYTQLQQIYEALSSCDSNWYGS